MYPIYLKLTDKHVALIGAGRVAEHKIQGLLDAGANITVVAPKATDQIVRLSDNGLILWKKRPFRRADLKRCALVITATNNSEVNARVHDLATKKGLFINSVDDPEHCSFYVPAVVNREPLLIAVSTSGSSPLFAKRIRRYLERKLPEDIGEDIKKLGAAREDILARLAGLSQRERALRIGEQLGPEVQSIIERIEKA